MDHRVDTLAQAAAASAPAIEAKGSYAVAARDLAVPRHSAMRLALLESRQRWRQFGAIAADMLFEADAAGHLTFVAPEPALGWPTAALLGQPGFTLLHDPAGADPFRFTAPIRQRRVWMQTMQGERVCMSVSAVPLCDEAGRHRGVRGVAVDVTRQEDAVAETARALRRSQAFDHILDDVRQEVLAPRMMRAVLDGVFRALGAVGAAVLDLLPETPGACLHEAGEPVAPLLPELLTILGQCAADPGATPASSTVTAAGRDVLTCIASTRFGDTAALVVWRETGGRPWDRDDMALAGSVAGVMRIVLEHESIQRELARQARTDPLTGLLNRRAFLEEATRRLDRLETEGMPASLLFIDLDGFKQLNDSCGHETGDAALILTSALLRRTFRPTDLVARLGGDEFACWLDGADTFTAAERAEGLRLLVPREFAHLMPPSPQDGVDVGLGMSIGIAMRRPGTDETLDQLLQRADQAMYDVKRNGRGHWRVSNLPGQS